MKPYEKYHNMRPKVGDRIEKTPSATNAQWEYCGTVERVDGNICHYRYREPKHDETDCFIWCFADGLNTLHRWMPDNPARCEVCGLPEHQTDGADGFCTCTKVIFGKSEAFNI